VNIGFSQTADPELVLAGNVISLPHVPITTGAMVAAVSLLADDPGAVHRDRGAHRQPSRTKVVWGKNPLGSAPPRVKQRSV
jgi:hypothetical protein